MDHNGFSFQGFCFCLHAFIVHETLPSLKSSSKQVPQGSVPPNVFMDLSKVVDDGLPPHVPGRSVTPRPSFLCEKRVLVKLEHSGSHPTSICTCSIFVGWKQLLAGSPTTALPEVLPYCQLLAVLWTCTAKLWLHLGWTHPKAYSQMCNFATSIHFNFVILGRESVGSV